MKKSILFFIFYVVFFNGYCQRKIEGNIGDLQIDKIYLFEVINELREIYRVIDSAEVRNGNFVFVLDEMTPELYFLGDNLKHGGYFFLDRKNVKLTIEQVTEERIRWRVKGASLDKLYRKFANELYVATNKRIRDSLDRCFYKARDMGDEAEMARIKKESIPYYTGEKEIERALVNQYLEKNRNNAFGMYLYYSKIFQFKNFPTLKDVDKERAYIKTFGMEAKKTSYMAWMEEQVTIYENCSIGHEAPEIVGKDTLGNTIRLSDFRGNYVLIDFWHSYCYWCRKEVPALKKALKHFEGKKFKILGVSSDFQEERWKKIIREDESFWDHMILERGNPASRLYCVRGVPYIILVGPDGKILTKGLRGQDLINIPDKFMK